MTLWRSFISSDCSFCETAVHDRKYGSKTIILFNPSRRNLSNQFFGIIGHYPTLPGQIINCQVVFLYLRPPGQAAALINANFHKLDSSFTSQPPSSTSKQTMIYLSRDLWSIGVPKYQCLLSQSFIHAPTADKVKLVVDALDDFIQILLMCLLCTINLKPLGVSTQSVASAALLLQSEMISCFVNCGDGDACI